MATTNFIGVLLPNSPDYTVNTGFSTELYDADGGQTIIVQPGASLDLLGALGANTIKLAGASIDWQVMRDGSNLVALRTDGSRVEVPANATAQSIVFSDVALALRVVVNGSTAAVMLGTQALDTTAAPVGGLSIPGSTHKAPWTLVVPTSTGVYASDGSADGSKYLATGEPFTNHKVVANDNQTVAVFTGNNLYGTDGTAVGTVNLAPANYFYGQQYYKIGNKIVLSDGGSSFGQGFVTDGTKAGTVTLADLPAELVDPVAQTLWGGLQTGPYGRELFKTTVTDSGASSAMVKDVLPGSASGVPYYSPGSLALLPNGRIVFSADDGAGSEPWVSDGTTGGTVKLADLKSVYGSAPGNFTTVGDKVLFVADVDGKGNQIVATDGTAAGTKVLDAGLGSLSFPAMLGVINGTLYFTAHSGADYLSVSTLLATDGASIRQVAKLGSASVLLGWAGDKAFLKSSDPDHGQELWVINLADGTTQLVKDILPGTGSALADAYSGSTFMVGSRIAFSAYISPTDKAFFLSDGTAAGTWQIAKEAPKQTLLLGQNIFFSDSEGTHVVDSSGHVSLLGAAQTNSSYSPTPFQSDKDQVYFLAANNALYSSSGGTAVQLADGAVSQFVVGENGVYFIKTTADNAQNLWFSDGTAAGTFFVRALPSSYYDLNDAAGVHTPGVPLPNDSIAPQLSFAKVSGNKLTLAFSDDNALDGTHLPPASAFHLAGTSATITGVSADPVARTIVLTLSEGVKSTDKILVSYTDPTAADDTAAIQDSAGNDAASFADHFVQNLTPDNVAPVLVAASVDGNTLSLSYLDASVLDASHLPAAGAFKLEGTTATVSAVAVDTYGTKIMLTLSQPVLSTDSIKLSYTDPSTGDDAAAVQDLAGNDAASVSGFAVQNKTLPLHGKAPWTLLVATNAGVYTSDGTTAGTKLAYAETNYKQIIANADKTAAIMVAAEFNSTTQKSENVAVGFDGSGNTPPSLARGFASNAPQVLGKYFILPNFGPASASALVTDGTVANSHLVPNLQSGITDPAHLQIWNTQVSDPYGYELNVTRISDSGAVTSMVKDIAPGSASGLVQGAGMMVLPNGKLVFVGTDAASGPEPWVSDGTEAGTFRLAELQPGANTSSPQLLASFGAFVAMAATVYDSGNPASSLGRELVVTDGTSAGTHYFDIAAGADSSNPMASGIIGNTLYFLATTMVNNAPVMGLFVTDGTTFKRIADVSGGASVLGQAGSKVFLSMSDTLHGQELWASDSSGNFAIVKDILPGTGSALSGGISPMVVGDKLVFQAYTDATTKSLLISDGTANGTVALGAAPIGIKQAGHVLVYGDQTQIYGLDASAASPKAVVLTAGMTGPDRMQADADQVFFSTTTGDLFATDGTAGGTVALGHSVKSFKVAGENSLYFVEQDATGLSYSLYYSDGTAAGTYFVSNVDSDFANNFNNGVVVHTVGVPAVQH